MNKPLYRIVFKGEIAAGQDRTQVMQRVKALCKYDDATLTKFFSGKACVIKDRIDPQHAPKYKGALEQTGIICYVVKCPVPTVQSKSTPKVVSPQQPTKTMICPKCDRSQPEALLCLQCGINIERYQKRQLAEQEQEFVGSDDTDSNSNTSNEVTIAQLLLSPDGRVNRQKYILINLAMGLITIPAEFILVDVSVVAYLVAVLSVAYVSFILSIKRAHDRNLSGHFCWLLIIPIVSLWPCIVLTFLKGTDGSNRFGSDPIG